ncbi:MAG: sulfite exporter TauE/SafE family protein [Mariprofundaceae bacterium]
MLEFDPLLLVYGCLVGMLAGSLAGTLAGIAGLGGGLIYVPVFYALMPGDQQGISVHVMASMVAIVATGFFSARSHRRLGHVHMASFRHLIPGLILGASLGLWLTLQALEALVLLGLAALNGWIAFDYGREVRRHTGQPPLVLCSGPIGYVSGTLGIGGGTMLVPLLRRSLALRQAVGTSAACGFAMAAVAVLVNMLFEQEWHTMLAGEIWFLAGAWAGILLILPVCTHFAAGLHRRLSEEKMRQLLRAFFACLAMVLLLAAVVAQFRA